MTADLKRDITAIFLTALEAVRADNAIRANLGREAHDVLRVGDEHVEIGPAGVFAIAIGKASMAMMEAALDVVGEQFTAGIAVTKSESAAIERRVVVMHGSHPVPDISSLVAGEAVLDFAGTVPDGALVLCLISGGGSAIVENLRDGVELDRLRDVTSALLRAGASIHELNAVRSRMSRIKAGGLLHALAHARVHNLIVSDVLDDDLRTIASGPSVPPGDVDAELVARKYGIAGPIPGSVTRSQMPFPPTTIVANLSIALEAAASAAIERGYSPVVLTRSLDGEAREAGRVIAGILADSSHGATSFGRRTCLLAGGETTVNVRGSGKGGRNTEAALAAAIRLSGVDGVAIGCLATDGDDGTTGAAGGVVDGATVGPECAADAAQALRENDSFTFLDAAGDVLVTGPTGTNVNDLMIGLIE